jgi:hypothetical protein
MIAKAAFWFFLSSSLVGSFVGRFADAAIPPDPNYCDSSGQCSNYKVAVSFVPWTKLSSEQKRILLSSGVGPKRSDAETIYEEWIQQHDDHAAAFLTLTTALSRTTLTLQTGAKIPATEMILRINQFFGDRFYAAVQPEIFESWIQAKSPFYLLRIDKKSESGDINFHNGTSWGGSLHSGFDIQGFTSITKVPRIQINYRYDDAVADIDLDGYTPFLMDMIPNPKHITYRNSDARQWYSSFVKKFGDPGFKVIDHTH